MGSACRASHQLHRDEPDRALRPLSSSRAGESEWYSRIFAWWTAALTAEAAVLAGAPEAVMLLDRAERVCTRSGVLSLLVRRARALAAEEASTLAGLAEHLDALGAPYQAARTRSLAGGAAATP